MSIFIARQPIFDRQLNVYGYELLFRQNNNNYFIEMDDDIATAELIYNSFLVFGIDSLTDGAKAFINFSKGLVDSDFIELLPKDRIVVEVLERNKATQATKDACQRFKQLGYALALDDFSLDEDNIPLLDLVNILKVEFPSLSLSAQAALIQKYRGKVLFLAEKIETREEYQEAVSLGYDLFQGYFFSKPAMLKSKDIKTINVNLFRIMEELNDSEPNYHKISEIIQTDLGLSYKLLRLVNSAYIAPRHRVKTIAQALNYMGTRELYQWISLMMLKDMQDNENAELVKDSLIRGKMMSLLACELHLSHLAPEYFFTGLFSQIDVVLNRDLSDILLGLPLTDLVKKTLLGEKNDIRGLLDCIICIEKADWAGLDNLPFMKAVNPMRFMTYYVDAMKWAGNLNA
ncbi:HDOD domain-containing protein [Oscillospiraceae bacterium CM]|nr:HDOD domain-containing protein [Oscillospiraceae bacterium CM]